MFKRIDHVEIVTDRLDETVAFYTDVLGFTVGARDRIERPGGSALNLVYLGLGGTTVELMSWEGVPVAPQPDPGSEHLGYRMMAVEVEDMKDALAYLANNGIEPVWGPVFRDNYARAEIEDPNGHRIELRHWF
jgi:catechol 2,3-dioxygenase-like lactoylglutathione lyase family enzyme